MLSKYFKIKHEPGIYIPNSCLFCYAVFCLAIAIYQIIKSCGGLCAYITGAQYVSKGDISSVLVNPLALKTSYARREMMLKRSGRPALPLGENIGSVA